METCHNISGKESVETIDFSYEGYQVVRGEFFAHLHEPSITFNNNRVSLNMACLKRLPDVDYVQILVHPEEQKLAVRPSMQDEKDAFIWCSRGKKRRPKQITCHIFFAKIMEMMGWNHNHRYKLLGQLIRNGNDYLFTFDLAAPEIYRRISESGEKPKSARTPVFPANWKNQFGLPVDEHRKLLQVNIFKGYTVFSVKSGLIAEQPVVSESTQITEENDYER